MRIVLVSTGQLEDVLPAASLLEWPIEVVAPQPSNYADLPQADIVLVDATGDLARARALSQLLSGPIGCQHLMLILNEGGVAVLQADWGAADFTLTSVSPAELAARMRLLAHRPGVQEPVEEDEDRIETGDLVIDTSAYTARLGGRIVDLTFKEFELLRYMASHPERVLTREAIVDAVWGSDYIGGTRTVDVHIRRLRAKLGSEHDSMIGTVRNVGYRFNAPE